MLCFGLLFSERAESSLPLVCVCVGGGYFIMIPVSHIPPIVFFFSLTGSPRTVRTGDSFISVIR